MDPSKQISDKKMESFLFDQTVALKTLAALAIFYTLYFASELIMPISLAFLLYFFLFPVVKFFKAKFRIPKSIGAALALLFFVCLIGIIFYFLSAQAQEWMNKNPLHIDAVNEKLNTFPMFIQKPFLILSSAIENMESSFYEIGKILTTNWFSFLFSSTWNFFIESSITLIVLYFLLSSKTFFLVKIMKVLLNINRIKDANLIIRQIERQVWDYLFFRTMINIGVAAFTALFLGLYQVPNPILWGIMAGILEYIPFIGAFISFVAIFVVSFFSFDSFWHIILPPITFLVFISLEGNIFTPYFLGKNLVLNRVSVVLIIILFGWIWGVIGTFLAVPLLMTIKIISNNIEGKNSLNELLEE